MNLVFARLAKKHLTPDDLRRTAKELGFDGDVPIDVRASASALKIPDDPFGMAKAAAGFWNGKLTALGNRYTPNAARSRLPRWTIICRAPLLTPNSAACWAVTNPCWSSAVSHSTSRANPVSVMAKV